MGFITAVKNTMLDAIVITHASLHSANPGDTGASELTGGSYARKAITMSAATGASRSLAAAVDFDVPASTVAFVGFWNNSTYLGYDDVVSEVYAAPGIYQLKTGTLTIT